MPCEWRAPQRAANRLFDEFILKAHIARVSDEVLREGAQRNAGRLAAHCADRGVSLANFATAWVMAHRLGFGPSGCFWAIAISYSLSAVLGIVLFAALFVQSLINVPLYLSAILMMGLFALIVHEVLVENAVDASYKRRAA